MLTYSQRASFAREGARNINRTVDEAVEAVAQQREAEQAEARAAYEKATAAVPYTADELKTARAIRTVAGWHRVVRVNAKSVTVATPYSWTDRYPLGKILEVRS